MRSGTFGIRKIPVWSLPNPKLSLFPSPTAQRGHRARLLRINRSGIQQQAGERAGEFDLSAIRSLSSACCLSCQARVMTASFPDKCIPSLLSLFTVSNRCTLPAPLQGPTKTAVWAVAAYIREPFSSQLSAPRCSGSHKLMQIFNDAFLDLFLEVNPGT